MSYSCCTRFREHSSLRTVGSFHIFYIYDETGKKKVYFLCPSFGSLDGNEEILFCPFCGMKLE